MLDGQAAAVVRDQHCLLPGTAAAGVGAANLACIRMVIHIYLSATLKGREAETLNPFTIQLYHMAACRAPLG